MFSSVFLSIPPILASNSIVYAFKESDGLGQGICVLLLIISVAVWYIMLEKAGNLISAMKKSQAFLRAFREKRNPLGLKERRTFPSCFVQGTAFIPHDDPYDDRR